MLEPPHAIHETGLSSQRMGRFITGTMGTMGTIGTGLLLAAFLLRGFRGHARILSD